VFGGPGGVRLQVTHGEAMKVLLDTNVLVAAAFRRDGASARIVEAVRAGTLELVWNEATRAETRHVLRQIPPLNWEEFSDLFRPECRYDGRTRPDEMAAVADPADRKFAALAAATSAVLVTNDDHLLDARHQLTVDVLRPPDFVRRHLAQ
jgi:predicted nucleic acid-binding protein